MNCMSFERGKPKDIYILLGTFALREESAGENGRQRLPTVCCDALARANDA
jgi:hypothetical protein